MPNRRAVIAAALFAAAGAAFAEGDGRPTFEGWLCCNLRSDGNWISDINYAGSGKRLIPVGTPVKVTGYGRNRVLVEIEGQPQAIGNDYSRDVELTAFARRYVVAEDPRPKLARLPRKLRAAIESARVMRGMTREQVLMAVGYPVASENPQLDAKTWRFWIDWRSEFQVSFDAKTDRVKEIVVAADKRALVVAD